MQPHEILEIYGAETLGSDDLEVMIVRDWLALLTEAFPQIVLGAVVKALGQMWVGKEIVRDGKTYMNPVPADELGRLTRRAVRGGRVRRANPPGAERPARHLAPKTG
ncbi:MAG: hypothetical protein ACYDBQ_10635 [Thermoplasmatota archaeon]